VNLLVSSFWVMASQHKCTATWVRMSTFCCQCYICALFSNTKYYLLMAY